MELGFILKKTISVMIMPMSIALFILLIGLIVLYKNRFKLSKIILSIGFITLILFSYSPVSNSLINTLEKQYPKLESIPKDTKYILLLGGGFEKRAWELLRLYSKNKSLKIITSGYEGTHDIPEAIRSANILIGLGIPKESIITHSKPKDTKEEAKKIKEVLGDKSFILVTAGYHMPRAIALFKKEKANPIAAPTNFMGGEYNFLSFPSVGNLYKTHVALHEYIGLLWAKLRGQI